MLYYNSPTFKELSPISYLNILRKKIEIEKKTKIRSPPINITGGVQGVGRGAVTKVTRGELRPEINIQHNTEGLTRKICWHVHASAGNRGSEYFTFKGVMVIFQNGSFLNLIVSLVIYLW